MTRRPRVLAMLSLLGALAVSACAPGEAVGDRDAGSEDMPPQNPYVGTCAESLFTCFDWRLPCEQQGGKNFSLLITYATGATLDLKLDLEGTTAVATSSTGERCFTQRPDPDAEPASPELAPPEIFEGPDGEIRFRYGTDTHEIVCPDGTTATVKGSGPPHTLMLDTCTLAGQS